MIDNFSILLSHGWLLLAFWILINRDDLDSEAPPAPDPEPLGFNNRKTGANKTAAPKPKNPFSRAKNRKGKHPDA
jgi:hypothetical protein